MKTDAEKYAINGLFTVIDVLDIAEEGRSSQANISPTNVYM